MRVASYVSRPQALLLRIPPIAFVLREAGFGGPAGFFEEQHFEVEEAKPGWVYHVVIVAAVEFWEHVAQEIGRAHV